MYRNQPDIVDAAQFQKEHKLSRSLQGIAEFGDNDGVAELKPSYKRIP